MAEAADPVVLSLGSVNADFQMRVGRPLGSGETLPARDFTRLSGGKAANRAFLARRLGLAAWLLGRVGEDELAEQALAPLRAAGVDLVGVSTATGCPTAFSVIAVPPDGKKSILLAGNANDAWDEAAVNAVIARIAAAPARSVLAVDYEVPAPVIRRAAEAARTRGIPLVIDPSWPDRLDREVLAHALAVAPNAAEAEALTDARITDPESAARAARHLGGLGARLALVKLKDGGCVLWADGGAIHIPPVEVAVVDSTGAGDAFTGALAVALLEGQAPRDAALFATAASHQAVTAWGSQPAYPTRARIEALLPRLARTACALRL